MGLSLILFYEIKINCISLSFVLFAISAIISSALNGFVNFTLTPIYLIICSFVIYEYCIGTKKLNNLLLFSAYIGVILFSFLYCFKYKSELMSLNFDRLGRLFGDENDIAIFMSFGLVMSFYAFLESKSFYGKCFSLILFLIFGLCGISSGSKIFILIVLVCCCLIIFLHFGLKKWWASVLVFCIFIGMFVFLIRMPFFETLRARLDSFISSLFKIGNNNGTSNNASTIDRLNMFFCGMQMFLRKPLFGYGILGFSNFGNINNGWSHNNFSETLCNFGLVGTFFFHFGYITSLVCYFKTHQKKSKQLSIILMALFLCMMFSVALNSQKIYAYLVPICIASLMDDCNVLTFKVIRGKNESC